MEKRAYKAPAEVGDVFGDYAAEVPQSATVRVRISGLREVAPGEFEIDGVRIREIHWGQVAAGLGRKFVPDALANEIDGVCFSYDVAECIAARTSRFEG